MTSLAKQEEKTTVYVGGLDHSITEDALYVLFLPFGEIKDIVLPKDYNSYDPHRGFALIDYETGEDAKAAIDNMHHAELAGKIIKCSIAKGKWNEFASDKYNIGGGTINDEPIWANDEWLRKYGAMDEIGAIPHSSTEVEKETDRAEMDIEEDEEGFKKPK